MLPQMARKSYTVDYCGYRVVFTTGATPTDTTMLVRQASTPVDPVLQRLELDGWLLGQLPPAARTPVRCLTAIKCTPAAFEFIPLDLDTEICLYCVKREGLLLQHVPMILRTESLYSQRRSHKPAWRSCSFRLP